jgi:pseudaminic acid cytidylyltransferase
METIAIIPARIGSKRLLRKNLTKINNKFILEILISRLIISGKFSRIIVSTDSDLIRNIAIKSGAQCNKLRPRNLSGDNITTQDVIKYEINNYKIPKNTFVFCFYPSSILFLPSDIKKAKNRLVNNKFKFVVSVYKPNSSPLRAFKISKFENLQMLHPKYFNKRSQDLTEVFNDAGLFYLAYAHDWLESKLKYDSNSTYVKIPLSRVADLNYIEDLVILKILWNHLKRKEKLEIK